MGMVVLTAHTCCQAGSLQVTLGEEAVFFAIFSVAMLLTDKFRTERTERQIRSVRVQA